MKVLNHHERELATTLTQKLQELRDARHRVEELAFAYGVVERSKFAELRRLWNTTVALIDPRKGESSTPVPLIANGHSANGHSMRTDPLEVAGLRRELAELQAERLGLLDVVESERAAAERSDPYARWMLRNAPRQSDFDRMAAAQGVLAYRPLFSILMATYNTPERYLRAAIESVRNQIYDRWELCIADDASPQSHVRALLTEYAQNDERIKVVFRPENGHISRATNSALELATGEFVGFFDHDDVLTRDALYEMAVLINNHRDADMIYSDEDKIDESNRLRDPYFKTAWCPDSFLSRMYTCHFSVYRRELVQRLGGLRSEFDGSQDYDLVLRLTEQTEKIFHIPKVLYHWRIHPDSSASSDTAKPYAARAAERAIEEALARRGEPGTAAERPGCPGTYLVRYEIKKPKKVSIIIPTRNHAEDVDRCFKSIFEKTTYKNFDIVLLDNGSDDPKAIKLFDDWARREPRVKVLRHDVPFNFSAINNYAVRHSDGDYVLLLNNDTEVISPEWLTAMVEQVQRPSIGCVGALLLYPDGAVQHAGVIIGLGGVAGHSHKHFPGDAPGYYYMLKAVNNYSAVTAACLMIRREVFEQVGGLDEGLAVAFNDVDFCMKVQAAGYRSVYLPHVQLYHFESKSRGYETTPEKVERFQREINTMLTRWNTEHWSDPCYSPNLTRDYENFAIADR